MKIRANMEYGFAPTATGEGASKKKKKAKHGAGYGTGYGTTPDTGPVRPRYQEGANARQRPAGRVKK